MDRPTVKKTMIMDFAENIASDEFKENSLILVTSAGVIYGSPVLNEEVESFKTQKFSELLPKEIALSITSIMASSSYSKYEKEYKINSALPEDDGYILLKDVILHTSNSTYNFASLAVFFDEIVGVSIGNMNT